MSKLSIVKEHLECLQEDCFEVRQELGEYLDKDDEIIHGVRKLKTYATKLEEILKKVRMDMVHRFPCASVNPTDVWDKHGSISFDGCRCLIKEVDAILVEHPPLPSWE